MTFRKCSLDTQQLVLWFFARANPMFCFDEMASESPLAPYAKDMLTHLPDLQLIGNPLRIEAGKTRAGIARQITVSPVIHVFPVFSEWLHQGMMAPLGIVPSRDWSVSDAFGTFGYPGRDAPMMRVFEDFLKRLEQAWKEVRGRVLPLRWRRAFSLSLKCPLHFEALGGESLQVPLAVAVLRAFSESLPTATIGPRMAFGYDPVFSTGILDLENGVFRPVKGLEAKLSAFIREYGPGLPAILTTEQIADLDRTAPDLMPHAKVFQADSLSDLMRLEEIRMALDRLCLPPEPPELDHLLNLLFQLQRSIRFADMTQIIEWLRPYVTSPVYQLKLELHMALISAHRGRFQEAGKRLDRADHIHRQHPDWVGIRERIDLTTARGTMAFDACEPDWVQEIPAAALAAASPEDQAKYWGAWCQIYRLRGDLDRAVEAGRESVRLADWSLAGEAGRDRNYLVYALIARVRASGPREAQDLEEAETLLKASQTGWAPVGSRSARQSHLGFCLHFEAEIARLKKRPFTPPDHPPWEGDWGHPWMFVLLSCSRNTRHDPEARRTYAENLTAFSAKWVEMAPGSLFELFDATYRIYHAALTGGEILSPLRRLQSWLDHQTKEGYPGWGLRLRPMVSTLLSTTAPLENAEGLCDAIPYH